MSPTHPLQLDAIPAGPWVRELTNSTNEAARVWLDATQRDLADCFGVEFTIWNSQTGEIVRRGTEICGGEVLRVAILRIAESCREPLILGEEDGVAILAIPLAERHNTSWMATAAFVCDSSWKASPHFAAAEWLGLESKTLCLWCEQQPPWTTAALLRLGRTWLAKQEALVQAADSRAEVDKIADNLALTYEEITLLYGVTQNLRISSSDEDTGRFALNQLVGCLPSHGVAIQLLPVASPDEATYRARTESMLITQGDFPLNNDQMSSLIQFLELAAGAGPLVANAAITSDANWPFPSIRQLIIVPMSAGEHLFGWIAAVNHVDDAEFNTVEASLLQSVGVMLGIHSGNRELYRQQAELLASVVRALTSAIDAKDPYTCGHSDRVARIAVRLAQELNCDQHLLNTMYMAGLLHDVGKIGIQESVLRKPDKLTPEEYEHIKLHPELGHRILADIKQLRDILPAVLHHHEQWDGHGYPYGLSGENIPRIARIMAVADAYDAMFSSRPYRPGLPEQKVETILRDGAGSQWDAEVVDAYFRAREDIRDIGRHERANLSLDVRQWTQ